MPDGGGRSSPTPTGWPAALARAAEAGVTRLVCVGTGAGSSAEAVALARSCAGPAAGGAEGVGCGPPSGCIPTTPSTGVDSLDAVLAGELAGAGDPVVVGIGECGLDYHYDHSPRPAQREAFAPRSSWPTATAWPW